MNITVNIAILLSALISLLISLVVIIIRSKAEIYALKKENADGVAKYDNAISEKDEIEAKYLKLVAKHQISPDDIASCGEDRMDQGEMDL